MHRTARRRVADGFTILELLVAITLLSVLAVLSWRGMTAVVVGRDTIVERSDELRMLTTAMAQIDEDLRRSWPVRLLDLSSPTLAFSLGTDREPPALQLQREAGGGGGAMQVQTVVWRLRGSVIERGFSHWAMPTPNGESAVAPELTWQPVIGGVEGLEFRAWLAGRGWVPAATVATEQAARAQGGTPTSDAAAGSAQPQAPLLLVTGVEMAIVRRGERIVRVFSVAD